MSWAVEERKCFQRTGARWTWILRTVVRCIGIGSVLAIAIIDRRQAHCRRDYGAAGGLGSIIVDYRVDLVPQSIVGIDFGQHCHAVHQ